MNDKKEVTYLELFLTFFKINAFTFGGGYTIVPVIMDEFIRKKNVIEEDEMFDIVALAQSGPGAMAISTTILVGYKIKGPLGAIISTLASVLPCIMIISVISIFYQTFKTNFYVQSALLGISGVISAVLFITTFNMGKNAMKEHPIFSCILMFMSFVLGMFTNINTGVIIVSLGIIGLITFTVFKEGVIK